MIFDVPNFVFICNEMMNQCLALNEHVRVETLYMLSFPLWDKVWNSS
jgi:hypothetical protein